MPSPEEQEMGLSKGELELAQGSSPGELGLGFSQGELELGLGLRQGEDPEDHHNRHVTGLLPHPARPTYSQGEQGLRPHPARQVCQRGLRLPSSTGEPLWGPCRGVGSQPLPRP